MIKQDKLSNHYTRCPHLLYIRWIQVSPILFEKNSLFCWIHGVLIHLWNYFSLFSRASRANIQLHTEFSYHDANYSAMKFQEIYFCSLIRQGDLNGEKSVIIWRWHDWRTRNIPLNLLHNFQGRIRKKGHALSFSKFKVSSSKETFRMRILNIC